jgi:hypothetical protein
VRVRTPALWTASSLDPELKINFCKVEGNFFFIGRKHVLREAELVICPLVSMGGWF